MRRIVAVVLLVMKRMLVLLLLQSYSHKGWVFTKLIDRILKIHWASFVWLHLTRGIAPSGQHIIGIHNSLLLLVIFVTFILFHSASAGQTGQNSSRSKFLDWSRMYSNGKILSYWSLQTKRAFCCIFELFFHQIWAGEWMVCNSNRAGRQGWLWKKKSHQGLWTDTQ